MIMLQLRALKPSMKYKIKNDAKLLATSTITETKTFL